MKIIDNIPIIIVIAALFINIAIGVNSSISFSILMVRCIVVTIVSGVFSYILIETVKSTIECSSLSKHTRSNKKETEGLGENSSDNNSILDIKVPPLDDEELINMNNDSDNGFVEVNPVNMGKFNQNQQA